MIKKLKRIPVFFKEVKEELKKVKWSTRQELIAAASIVVVVAMLLTIYIFTIDLGLSYLIQLILK